MDEREASDRFFHLVEEFRLAGWIGLGKIRRPESEDARPDLALARHAIDTLGMLEVKTRGNRSDTEERLLRQALADLRLNFADEVKRAKEGLKTPSPEPGSPGPGSPGPKSSGAESSVPASPETGSPETGSPQTETPTQDAPGQDSPRQDSPKPDSPGRQSPGPEPASQGESPPAAGSGP